MVRQGCGAVCGFGVTDCGFGVTGLRTGGGALRTGVGADLRTVVEVAGLAAGLAGTRAVIVVRRGLAVCLLAALMRRTVEARRSFASSVTGLDDLTAVREDEVRGSLTGALGAEAAVV